VIGTDFASTRRIWADYFDSQGIRYAFYSATNATARQEILREASAAQRLTSARDSAAETNQRIESSEEDREADVEGTLNVDMSFTTSSGSDDTIQTTSSDGDVDTDDDDDDDTNNYEDPRAKVLSVLELEDLFIASAPDLSGESWSVVVWFSV
jgi:large subunit GTPase 1